jgi:nucleoside-diphosphate-sugar epimerase
VPIQVGSAQKIKRELGWQAKIPVTRSLSDLLKDWRKKIKQEDQ